MHKEDFKNLKVGDKAPYLNGQHPIIEINHDEYSIVLMRPGYGRTPLKWYDLDSLPKTTLKYYFAPNQARYYRHLDMRDVEYCRDLLNNDGITVVNKFLGNGGGAANDSLRGFGATTQFYSFFINRGDEVLAEVGLDDNPGHLTKINIFEAIPSYGGRKRNILGRGILSWLDAEQSSGRYGYIFLRERRNSEITMDVRPFKKVLAGKKGKLIAVVGGNPIELGKGTLSFIDGKQEMGIYYTVGLTPDLPCANNWLNSTALQQCHEQRVELYFES